MPSHTAQYTIRQLSGAAEYKACWELQKQTWGEQFSESVPPSILMVGQKIGGVSAGAFDADGKLVGFVFGLTGSKEGKLVHWSDMLAVQPHARDAGLGRRLKLFQRQHCLDIGAHTIYWTFDPLEAKNDHLNFNKLGANIDEYVADMYVNSDSVLHRGLAMDRFVIAWRIASDRVEKALAGTLQQDIASFELAPIANTHPYDKDAAKESAYPRDATVRVEIPADIQRLKTENMDRAIEWRASTRAAFLHYQQAKYQVDAFYREPDSGRCFYVLHALSA